ncbi:MAG: mechanosensitive ion channel family protein [Dehalococcoidales bacterium]
MMEIITNWLSQIGWKIFVILAIVAAIYVMIRRLLPAVIRRTVRQRMRKRPKVEREKRADTLIRIISSVLIVGIGIITLFIVLQQAGINITAALAGLGIVGIAVGFGAQYLIRDLIAGFFVFLENQYNVGDVIRVGDIGGIVEEISVRRTILRDLDGARHIIPNGEIRTVSNLTQEWSRAHINISVAYKEDLDRVMALMRKTWEEMAQDPEWSPFMKVETPWLLRVDEFGNSGINIKMVGETEPIKQWDIMGEFRRRIKKVFDQEGIEIPWPHVKLYLGDEPVKKRLSK